MRLILYLAVFLSNFLCTINAAEIWHTQGFTDFSKGTFGNSGQNIYVSHSGELQRIHQSDIDLDGEIDLLFCNSQGHEEYVHPVAYKDVLKDTSLQSELRIGGVSSAIAVGDLNGDGFDEIVFACGWNGSSWIPNNVIFYGSPAGLSTRYQHNLITTRGRPAIGDFNGDKLPDVVFIHGNADKGSIELFENSSQGISSNGKKIEFTQKNMQIEANYIAAVIAVPDVGGDALIIRMNNGGLNIFRNLTGKLELSQEVMLEPDPDYKEVKNRLANNQFVPEPKPLLRKLVLNDKLYIFGAREKSSALYPYKDGKFDKNNAITFNISKALSVSAGDVRKNKLQDLVFAAQDSFNGKECSWYYPAAANGIYPQKSRIPIYSYRANDISLADLGGKTLSLIVMQSNIVTSYSGSTLLYKEFTGAESLYTTPIKLPCGDARMILTPRMKKHSQLVLPHTRSGQTTSILPVAIYTGKAGKYDPIRKIELMANGAMDGVYADLDNNGYPDVILANEVEMAPQLDDGSYVYFNEKNGFEKTPLKLPTKFASGVIVADFNKDGHLDIVFSALADELTMYYGEGNRKFKRCDIKLEKNCKTLWLASADLNYDGYLDLVVPTSANKSCILWGSQTGFNYQNRQDFNIPRSQNAKIADLDNDGYLDLIFSGIYPTLGVPHDSYVTIFYGSCEGFKDHRRTQLPCNNSNCVTIGDFNNDGLLDLFVGAYDSKLSRELDSHIYWNSPNDGFSKDNRSYLRTEAACGVMTADFNRDGYLDMAIVNHKTNTKHVSYSQVWYSDKGKFSSENTIKLPTSGPHGMINTPLQNIKNRNSIEEYISTVYERKSSVDSLIASISAQIPKLCKVKIALRSANTLQQLSAEEFKEIDFDKVVSIKNFPGKYLQYRLQLIAEDGINTPKVKRITLSFE